MFIILYLLYMDGRSSLQKMKKEKEFKKKQKENDVRLF